MNKATQKMTLLKHLCVNGSITSIEAVLKYNILRPSNRMSELKQDGYPINTEIVWKTYPDGSKTHYARYSMLRA